MTPTRGEEEGEESVMSRAGEPSRDLRESRLACRACSNFRQFRRKLPAMAPLRPIHIGPVTISDPVILAPMTGVTDLPFRKAVRRYGSGLNVTEMNASQAATRETRQATQNAAWDTDEEPADMPTI